MTTPEDQERELRLRELETEIYQQHKKAEIDFSQPPLHRTKKHQGSESSLKRFRNKIVKFGKFTAFVVLGIAFIRVGFLVGMWITYLALASILAVIGYQIFLKEDHQD